MDWWCEVGRGDGRLKVENDRGGWRQADEDGHVFNLCICMYFCIILLN